MNQKEIRQLAGELIFVLTHKWEYLRGKNEDFIDAIMPRLTRAFDKPAVPKQKEG